MDELGSCILPENLLGTQLTPQESCMGTSMWNTLFILQASTEEWNQSKVIIDLMMNKASVCWMKLN